MGKRTYLSLKIRSMKYVAAYCLLALAGKQDVSEADLKKFMTAAGCDTEGDNLKSVCDALKGKQLHEVINAGFGKISSLSLGGGGGSSAGGSGPTQEKAAEAVKEEKKEEV